MGRGRPHSCAVFARQISIFSLLAIFVLSSLVASATSDLWSLYDQRDYFSLRAALPPPRAGEPLDLAFLRAADDAASSAGQTATSELQDFIRRNPPAYLRAKAARLLMSEERARYRYRAALAAIEPLLAPGASQTADQADVRNSALLVKALADVPPQTTEQKASGLREVDSDRTGRFAVTIDGHQARLGFDTGADFSFLSASTARMVGLTVRRIGLAVASSTGTDAQAEVAAGDVTIGGTLIRNIVFLVLPDASLTMPDGFVMNGLLGTPVLSALGAVRFDKSGKISWFDAAPSGPPNLAMEGNEVLLQVDTGAENTVFYEPFYRRYPALFGDASRRHPLSLGGVSGAQQIPAYRLDAIDFTLAGQTVHLPGVSVMTRPIARPEENYAFCNIGADALSGFRSYTVDLRGRRLVLGP